MLQRHVCSYPIRNYSTLVEQRPAWSLVWS